ncbi:MAG: TatD family hydrolase [Candidatus Woesearchaeota archaeon]|jgi:TatD DNase family protein
MIIDIHAHLDYKNDDEIANMVKNAREKGVFLILNNGLNVVSNRKTLELVKKYDLVKAALAIYPDDVLQMSDVEIDSELEFIKKHKPIAIGECGLDYASNLLPNQREKQIKTFEKHILLANELHLPLIVHSRKAEIDVIDTLEKMKAKKVILHCFSGRKQLILKALKLGYYFSIPTNVTRSLHFQELVKQVPITQLFAETDTPFLSPVKDAENEPANVIFSYKKIAELKGMDETEVINSIFMNYQKLFL